MSNQEKKKKKKIRIRTKDFLKSRPRVEYRTVGELYSMLDSEIKKEEYKEISESLKEHGYNPTKEKFNFIKIQQIFDIGEKVIDGKKRVVVLGKDKKDENKKIQVISLSPEVARVSVLHVQNMRKLERRLNNEFRQKNNNTKDSK